MDVNLLLADALLPARNQMAISLGAHIILACFVVGIIGFFLDRLMIILQRLVSFDDGSATA